jgi:hypothetical protein
MVAYSNHRISYQKGENTLKVYLVYNKVSNFFFESLKDAERFRDSLPTSTAMDISEINIMPDSEKDGMKAILQPLDGKYYESKIEIKNQKGETVFINLYCTDTYKQSERELEEIEPGDNHYEKELTYKVCKKILECFNG